MEELKTQPKAPVINNQMQQKAPDKKTDPYKVYGKDFSILEADYIEFYKNRFKFLAFSKNLVGRFNDKGQYIIAPQVKADIKRMPKEIEDMGSDFYKASNVYMKKFFYFDIKIVEEKDKAKASLYLIENVGECFEDPHIRTHIADFIDVYDDEYRVKLRKAFNLVDIAVPVSDILVPELAVIMQDNYDFMLINQGLHDIINQIYLLRMLELLEKSGENGKAIIEEYKEIVAKVEPELQKTKYKNNTLKQILDRVIDKHGGIEKIEVNKEVKGKAVKEVNTSIKQVEAKQKSAAGVELVNTKEKEQAKVVPIAKKSDKMKSNKDASKKEKPKAEKAQKSSGKKAEFDNYLIDAALDGDDAPVVESSPSLSADIQISHDFSGIEISAREDYSSLSQSENTEHNGIDLDDDKIIGEEDSIVGKSILDEELSEGETKETSFFKEDEPLKQEKKQRISEENAIDSDDQIGL